MGGRAGGGLLAWRMLLQAACDNTERSRSRGRRGGRCACLPSRAERSVLGSRSPVGLQAPGALHSHPACAHAPQPSPLPPSLHTSTHRPVMEQCLARSGRTILQLTHSWFHCPAQSAGESRDLQGSGCASFTHKRLPTTQLLSSPPVFASLCRLVHPLLGPVALPAAPCPSLSLQPRPTNPAPQNLPAPT